MHTRVALAIGLVRLGRYSLKIDYLAIGHICADLQPDGSTRLGGTALFAALTAHQLGVQAAIVTACAADLDLSALPVNLPVLRQLSQHTTLFENRYSAEGRTQLLHRRAEPIDLQGVPAEWQDAPIVHLAPIMQELPIGDSTLHFPNALVTVTPQGWLRHVHPSHIVTTTPTTLRELPLAGTRLVIVSEEDVQGDEQLVWQLSQRIPLVVLTRAERGATVLCDGQAIDVPAFQAQVVDPTGAGDVFAAALSCALYQGDEPVEAARWACATAAYAIEAPGATGLPTAAMVRHRMSRA